MGPLSFDLRKRVVAAICEEGLSCRAAARRFAERTVAGLIAILEGCADLFKPTECQNFFQACGYDTT